MPRNQEVIRQWKVLHALESSRHGATIDALAGELDVTTRTIRRDLAALQEAGFPLYDERDEDGRAHWRLDGQVLKGLETGFTLAELCALYLSRNLLEAVAGTPFQRDLTLAFTRLEKMLSPRMRQFLDRLPPVLAAKPGPRARGGDSSPDIVARLLEATLHFRVAHDEVQLGVERPDQGLRRPSVSAGIRAGRAVSSGLRARVQGRAHVRHRSHRRRSRSTSRRSRRRATIPDDVFGNSLGVNTGPAVARRDRVRHARRAVRPRPRLASVAGAPRTRRRRRRADAGRLPRLGAAQLDSRAGAHRAACSSPASLAADDPRRSQQRQRSIPGLTCARRPLRLVAPRRVRAALPRRAVARPLLHRLALVRRGRLSAGLHHDRSERGVALHDHLRRSSVLWLVVNLRLALGSVGDGRPIFTTQQGIEVALPGRQQLRTIASAIAMVLAR